MRINHKVEIPESDLSETFIKGSGPGGQNINKVATAVQLRYDLRRSRAISSCVKSRIYSRHHNRINKDGELIVEMSQYRTQSRNREKARETLRMIIRDALREPRRRRKTKPSYRSRQARLDKKKKHARKKALRGKVYRE